MGLYQEAVREECERRNMLTAKHHGYVEAVSVPNIDMVENAKCPRCGYDMAFDYEPEEAYYDGKFVREELLECLVCGLRFYMRQEYVATELTVMVDNVPEWDEED